MVFVANISYKTIVDYEQEWIIWFEFLIFDLLMIRFYWWPLEYNILYLISSSSSSFSSYFKRNGLANTHKVQFLCTNNSMKISSFYVLLFSSIFYNSSTLIQSHYQIFTTKLTILKSTSIPFYIQQYGCYD